jgi:hypothetical protein
VGALAAAPAAHAGSLTVTNGNDAGAGSLRDTIALANPGDTVVIPASVPKALVSAARPAPGRRP